MSALFALGLALALQAPAEEASTLSQSAESMRPASVLAETPASVVAARVRAALADDSDTGAWNDLAAVLPELALRGGADLSGTFEAARLADSISAAGILATPFATGPSGDSAGGTPWGGWPTPADIGALLAGLVAVAAVVGAGLPRKRQGIAAPARPAQPNATPPAAAPRIRVALSLAARGTPPAEIARRTGMAQDALTLLITRQGS